MAETHTDRLVSAAMRVQRARDELKAAEAELASLRSTGGKDIPPPSMFDAVPDPDETPLRQRVRDLMADGRERTTEQVAEALGERQVQVGDAMKRLASRGDLRRLAPGRYVLTPVKRAAGRPSGPPRGRGGPHPRS